MKRRVVVLAVAALLLLSGCAGLSGPEQPSETTTAPGTTTAVEPTTTQPATTTSTTAPTTTVEPPEEGDATVHVDALNPSWAWYGSDLHHVRSTVEVDVAWNATVRPDEVYVYVSARTPNGSEYQLWSDYLEDQPEVGDANYEERLEVVTENMSDVYHQLEEDGVESTEVEVVARVSVFHDGDIMVGAKDEDAVGIDLDPPSVDRSSGDSDETVTVTATPTTTTSTPTTTTGPQVNVTIETNPGAE